MQDLLGIMDQLRSSKGVFELQNNGHVLVQKVREMREANKRSIEDHIAMLRRESEEAKAKVDRIT